MRLESGRIEMHGYEDEDEKKIKDGDMNVNVNRRSSK